MNPSLDKTVTDVVDKNEVKQTQNFHLTPEQLVKQENDIELINECRQILVDHAIDPQHLAVFDNSPVLNNAKKLTTAAQRIALNQFWHLQMGPFGRLSHQQRFKLIENGTAQQWLDLFAQGPVQFIIDNKLPVTL